VRGVVEALLRGKSGHAVAITTIRSSDDSNLRDG